MKNFIALVTLVLATGVLAAETANAAKYDQVVQKLNSLTAANPDLVQVFTLGKNDAGNPILGIKIQSPKQVTPGPAIVVVGTHHGNEPHSATVALKFAEDVIQQILSPTEGAFAKFADQTYYVIPVLNIPGYNANVRYETNAKGKSIDPNRDYPDPCGNPTTFQLASTKALADLMKEKNVLAGVTIHGYIGTFTFPWGIYTDNPRTEDDVQFAAMGNEAVKENGYDTGTHTEVIYPTVGAFEDWSYHQFGTWMTLLEVRNNPNVANDSKALLRYFSLVPNAKSTHHSHLGTCTNRDRANVRSRP